MLCSKCKQDKSPEAFDVAKSMKRGRNSQCKSCRAQYRKANRDKINAKAKEYREKHKENIAEWREANRAYANTYRKRNPEKAMYSRIKTKCKAQGIPFDLEPEDIKIPAFCPVLGIKLKLDNPSGQRADSPSLDRFIPSLGYVKGNVHVISMKANVMKNDASIEEVRQLLRWMEEITDGEL